jgi:hypothetical protein
MSMGLTQEAVMQTVMSWLRCAHYAQLGYIEALSNTDRGTDRESRDKHWQWFLAIEWIKEWFEGYRFDRLHAEALHASV